MTRAATLVLLALVGCTPRDARVADSAAPGAMTALDSLRRAKGIDTTTGLYVQASVMSAHIEVMALDAYESDTLQWLARADTCVMLLRVAGPTARSNVNGGWYFYFSEGGVTIGPGHSRDVSAPPDLRHFANTATLTLPADTLKWAAILDTDAIPVDAFQRAGDRLADGSLRLTVAVVPTGGDVCYGDDCPYPFVSPAHGTRIGWSADSRYLLLAGAQDSSRWTAIDPKTLKPAGVDGLVPAPPGWVRVAIDDNTERSLPRELVAGKNRFASRADSIFVLGPNRDGVMTTRFVGPGIPVVATRHGHFVTAIRREKGKLRAVIYAIQVTSPSTRLACNAGATP